MGFLWQSVVLLRETDICGPSLAICTTDSHGGVMFDGFCFSTLHHSEKNSVIPKRSIYQGAVEQMAGGGDGVVSQILWHQLFVIVCGACSQSTWHSHAQC